MTTRLRRVYYRDLPPESSALLASPVPPQMPRDAAPVRELMDGIRFDFADCQIHSGQIDMQVESYRIAGKEPPQIPTARSDAALQITEVPGPESIVSRVQVFHRGKYPFMFPFGTALIGGAQNRVVVTPQLVRPGESHLDVCCIEAGRWDSYRDSFTSIQHVPGMFQAHVLREALVDRTSLQAQVWGLANETLIRTGALNETMDLMRSVETEHADQLPGTPPADHRVLFERDPTAGFARLQILADRSALPGTLARTNADLGWRKRLLSGASGGRQFFRIFDDEKHIAVQCLPDGTSLKDFKSRPLLFEYAEDDLKTSFVPPLEPPPSGHTMDISANSRSVDADGMLNSFYSAQAITRRDPAVPDAMHISAVDSDSGAIGSALLFKNQLVHLDWSLIDIGPNNN